MTEELTWPVGGVPTEVAFAAPHGTGKFPAVLVAHHREGLDDFTRGVVTRLAANGFAAAAPNFFQRSAVDVLTDAEIQQTIDDIAQALAAMPQVRADRMAILGHCLGGRTAFLGAATTDHFTAGVMLYGGKIALPRGDGPPPLALTKDIKIPFLGLYGADDTSPSPADVATLDEELTRFGIRHEFHSYAGAGHAFQYDAAPHRYRPAQAEAAWTRVIAFLKAELA